MGHGAGATTPGPQGPPSEPRFSETAAYSGEVPRRDPSDGDGAASRAAGIAGAEVHRFRVLRPHARGGLGTVSVALDADLNREVALKEIQEHHADDPHSRSRFLLEAEITGRLEHPGIVPVYALGTHADGRPFYAMRLIRGNSLKEAVAHFHADERLKKDPGERSLELRKLLRRFVDVCNAVEYAHGRGVLHRDLKPSNIMIGRYGETLVVDWGLAKCMGGPDAASPPDEQALVPTMSSGSSETLPGSAIGTPAYMSPEQADGDLDRLGARSDVYSLSATLYCLLTGRPPREGEEARAVLAAARRGEFTPLRQFDPSIDRALEAICAKAMAAKPEDRYDTAKALADDVERWMADEPVTAYRDPWATRAWRWLRRHQTAATAGGLLALIVVIGITSLSLISAARDREALKGKEAEEYRRQALEKEAETYVVKGLRVSERLRIDARAPGPDINRDLIHGLLTALERRDQDPEAAVRAARALREALRQPAEAEARKRAADSEAAARVLHRGIDVIERVRREFPERRSYRVLLGQYYYLLASTQVRPVTDLAGYEAMLSGKGDIAPRQRSELEAALALYDKAVATLPGDGEDLRQDWYLLWVGRGAILTQLGRFSEALLDYDQALRLAEDSQVSLIRAVSSVILKGAEVEQSHLPWSRPPRVDHAKAIRMAESLVNRDGVSQAAVYNAACASSLASVDTSASAAERGRRADRAMEYLHRIASQGYFQSRPKGILALFSGKDTLQELRTDHDLDPIRSRPDFRKLLADPEVSARRPAPVRRGPRQPVGPGSPAGGGSASDRVRPDSVRSGPPGRRQEPAPTTDRIGF
jgi:serine/threonine protein kinase